MPEAAQAASTSARQALRFLFAGGFNTIVTYALFWLLCAVMHAQLAFAIAYAIGIGLAYLLNALWVFGSDASWKGAATYPLLYLLTYLFNAGLMQLATDWLGWSPQLGLAVAICVSTPISFVLNRFFLLPAKNNAGDRNV
ncbi:MAG: GtrA family protein [Pseudomarimonas sp.]